MTIIKRLTTTEQLQKFQGVVRRELTRRMLYRQSDNCLSNPIGTLLCLLWVSRCVHSYTNIVYLGQGMLLLLLVLRKRTSEPWLICALVSRIRILNLLLFGYICMSYAVRLCHCPCCPLDLYTGLIHTRTSGIAH